ncbi:MAG: hypothetical protein N2747_05055 [Chitinophagaceae bacterium]|nr:hypothetical protein [Chitinophagaceae bacterium]
MSKKRKNNPRLSTFLHHGMSTAFGSGKIIIQISANIYGAVIINYLYQSIFDAGSPAVG